MFQMSLGMFCYHILQFDVIKKYLESGGSLLVLMGEGGESKFETNINFLLEEYGINVNTGMVTFSTQFVYF